MRTRTTQGLTEIIPSVQERHDQMLREHALRLFELLDKRLGRVEEKLRLEPDQEMTQLLTHMRSELSLICEANHLLDETERERASA